MGGASINLERLRLGKLKIVRRRLLQRYEHQPFISLLAGLYSCRWKRYQRQKTEPGQWCCKKVENVFFLLLIATFCLSLVFLYFWGEAQNDYNDFDWFIYGNVGSWILWSILILIASVFLFTYVAILVVLAVCLLSEGQQLHLHWSHKVGTLVVLVVSIAALVALSKLWSPEWNTILLSFQITAAYLHIGAIAVMVVLSWPVALYFVRMNKTVSQVLIITPFLITLVFLYLIPLGMYSPCILEEGTLPPKPSLIAHRGSPQLAPENTQMSFEKAVELGADGLETDVTISFDGVPFLMHDRTLKRTTDVQDVYPDLAEVNAATLSWDKLSRLNAGSWFLKNKPFSNVASLTPEDRKRALNQSIYKLSDFLELAHWNNKSVVFDLYRPPDGHPYSDSWTGQIVKVILNETSIDPRLVCWLTNDVTLDVQSMSPEFQKTLGGKAPVKKLVANRVVKLNLPYNEMSSDDIRTYAAANISTNLYVVSEPWLFSLAWCSGAYSVTTNDVLALKRMDRPLFLMTPAEYRVMWILTDSVSALLIALIFLLHWWRERGLSCCPENNGLLEELDMSLSEEGYGRSQPTSPAVQCDTKSLGCAETK